MGEKIKLNDYTAIQKSTAMLAALGFLINSMTANGDITAVTGSGTTVTPGNGVYDIETTNKNGNNAFNRFSEFNLDANNIANMYFGTKEDNTARNLFNFVDSQIKVDGTVNAIKNNKIGGNLYFLSSSGMVVGNTGVINTGALYVMVPTEDMYKEMANKAMPKNVDEQGNVIKGQEGELHGTLEQEKVDAFLMPLNKEGTIFIKGKVNAADKIYLNASGVYVGNYEDKDSEGKEKLKGDINLKSDSVETAYLRTGVVDFSDLVNIKDENGKEILNSGLGTLSASETGTGDIILAAKATAEGQNKTVYSEVKVNGNIVSSGDVLITSNATNESITEALESDHISKIVLEKDAKITAEKDIEINSHVWEEKKSLSADGVIESAITKIDSDITINGTLNAGGKVDIKSLAENGKYNEITKEYDDSFGLAEVSSKITVGSGAKINSGVTSESTEKSGEEFSKDIIIDSKAVSIYDEGILDNKIKDIFSEVLGMGTGLNLDGGYYSHTTSSEITVEKDAEINSAGKLDLNSFSESVIEGGPSTSFLQAKDFIGKYTQNKIPSAAAAYVETATKSEIIIDGKLTSETDMNINSTSKDKLRVSSSSGTLHNSAEFVVGVLAVSGKNNSLIQIDGEAESKTGVINIDGKTESSVRTEALASAPDKSSISTAINYTKYNSSSKVDISGKLTADKDIKISSENKVTDNEIITNNQIGTSQFMNNIAFENQAFTNLMSTIEKKFSKDDGGTAGTETGTSHFSDYFNFGAAVSVVEENNTSSVNIGKGAEITSKNGKIDVGSKAQIEDIHIVTKGKSYATRKDETKKASVSTAVTYTDINNSSDIIIDGTLTGNEVTVKSDMIMEYNRINKMIAELKSAVEILKEFKFEGGVISGIEEFKESIGKLEELKEAEQVSFGDEALTYITGAFNAGVKILEGLAEETAKEVYDVLKEALDFASAGSYGNFYTANTVATGAETAAVSGNVLWGEIDNSSKVVLGNNAFITAKTGNNASITAETGNISISSKNITEVIGIAGTLTASTKDGEGDTAVGGSFIVQNNDTSSIITAADGAKLISEQGNINLNADSNILNVGAAVAAGMGATAINGMVSYIGGNSDNKISVSNHALLEADKAVKMSAVNNANITNVVGSFVYGKENAAIGIGVAVNDYDVENKIEIADNDKEDGKEDKRKAGIYASSLDVSAKTDGMINAISVAGTMLKEGSSGKTNLEDVFGKGFDAASEIGNKAVGGISNLFTGALGGEKTVTGMMNLGNKGQGGGNGFELGENPDTKPAFGISGAGSISYNGIDNNTGILISGTDIHLKDGELKAEATDESFIGAWSGAAAVQLQYGNTDKKPGRDSALEGAIGINNITGNITSIIENSQITDAGDITVKAFSQGVQTAAGLGIAASVSEGESKSYQGGAAVSANIIDHDVTAQMNNVNVTDAGEIKVSAEQSDIQVTGGINIQAGQSNGSIGGSVIVANVDNDITAGITGGKYENVSKVDVEGVLSSTQVAAGIAVGAMTGSDSNFVIEGTAVVNLTDNTIDAKIDGAEIITAEDGTTGKVSVSARDTKTKTQNKYSEYLETAGIDATGETFYKDLDYSGIKDNGYDTEKERETGSVIVTAGATGVGGKDSAAGGAAVVYSDIDNTFSAQIKNSAIKAKEVSADASSNTLIVGVAGGTAVSTNKFAGMGSVTWQDITNKITSGITGSNITSGNVAANSRSDVFEVNVTGQVAYGKTAGFGAALTYSEINNDIKSYVDNNIIKSDIITVNADNNSELYGIAATVAASEKVAVQGTVALSSIDNNLTASVTDNKDENSEIENSELTTGKLEVTTNDNSDIMTIVVGVTGAGKVGAGGGVAYSDITVNDRAEIKDTKINALNNGTILVQAKDNSDIITVSVAAGGAGKVSVQGAAATSIIEKTLTANAENTDISTIENKTEENEEQDINDAILEILADNNGKIVSNATVASFAGTAGVGAGVSVNQITQNTSAVLSGGTQNVKEALVKGVSQTDIFNIGIGAGAGGTAGLAGSIAVNQITNNNTVSIKDGANLIAKGNVGIIAQSDDIIKNYAGTVAGAGTAAVGASTSVNQISGNTVASIEGATSVTAKGETEETVKVNSDIDDTHIHNTLIDKETVAVGSNLAGHRPKEGTAKTGLVLDSSATHTVSSFLVGGAGAGTAAVAGNVNVTTIDGKTESLVKTDNVNEKININGSNVSITAKDYTNAAGFVGSLAGAGVAGIGAASDTNILNRTTSVNIENANINATKGSLAAEAIAKQGISSFSLGAAAAGNAGVAATVGVTQQNSITNVNIKNAELIAGTGDIIVNASHLGRVHNGTGSAGAAITGAGVGAAVGYVDDEAKTNVVIDNTDMTATGKVDIGASHTSEVTTHTNSLGFAATGAGIGGSVSINNINSETSVLITGKENSKENKIEGKEVIVNASNKTILDTQTASVGIAGVGAGVGAGVNVNTINSKVGIGIKDMSIAAENGSIDINAKDVKDITQLSTTAGAGLAGIAADVLITNIGNKLESDKNTESVFSTINKINESQNHKYESTDPDYEGDKEYKDNTTGILKELEVKDSTVVLNTGKDGGASLTISINNSDITAENGNVNIGVEEQLGVDILAGAASGGGVGISGSVGLLDINRNNSINISSDSNITAEKDVKIENKVGNYIIEKEDNTTEEKGISLHMFQGSLGIGALGAAYAETNTAGNTGINISGSSITGKNININAKDISTVTTEATGVTAGAIAAGAIIAKTDNAGNTIITVADSEIAGAITSSEKDEKNTINITAERANEVITKATGGSAGVASGIGVDATAKDNGNSSVDIKADNTFTGEKLIINALNKPAVTAKAGSISVGILANVGVSKSTAEVNSKANISIKNGNKFLVDQADIVVEIGLQGNKNTINVETESAGGGLADIAFNESNGILKTKTDIEIGKLQYKENNGTALNVRGKNITKSSAEIGGINIGGVIAIGNNSASLVSENENIVKINGDVSDKDNISNKENSTSNLKSTLIEATSSAENKIVADGNGGGLIDATGIAAQAANTMRNSTRVELAGNWNVAESLTANALETNTANVHVDALRASLVGVSGTKAVNTIENLNGRGTEVIFTDGMKVSGTGAVSAQAKNVVNVNEKVEGIGYGGVVVQGATANNTVNKSTKVDIGEKVNITTSGAQTYEAKSEGDINVIANVKAGGLGAATNAEISNVINSTNDVELGKDSLLKTVKEGSDITLASSNNLDAIIKATADIPGAAAAASALVNNDITRTDTVKVNGDIYSINNINLYTGMSADKEKENLNVELIAEAFNRSAFTLKTDPKIDNKINQKNQVEVIKDADISSVRDINITANGGKDLIRKNTAEYKWYSGEGKDYTTISNSSNKGSDEVSTNNVAILNGKLTAGIQNKQNVTISGTVDITGIPDGTEYKDLTNELKEIFREQAKKNDNKLSGNALEEAAEKLFDERAIIAGSNNTPTIEGQYAGNIEYGVMDYGSSLINRYNELEKLMNSYSTGDNSDNKAYLGYRAEKARVLNELEKLGLVSKDANGKITPIGNMEVQYISLPDIIASGGNIIIDADNMKGNGDIVAQGAPEITIVNISNLYLKINDLKIGETGGVIKFNGTQLDSGDKGKEIINKLNKNDEYKAEFTTLHRDDSTDAKIVVDNQWQGNLTVKYKDGNETITQTLKPLVNIEINGNVENMYGEVNINNKEGDIVIQGKDVKSGASVDGKKIVLSAVQGSVSQGYTEGIVNIGDNPQSQWQSKHEGIIGDIKEDDPNLEKPADNVIKAEETTGTNGDGIRIAGGSIYINASDINLNGYVQSGYEDYELILEKDAADKIENWKNNYEGGELLDSELQNYRLNDGGKYVKQDDGSYKYIVQAYYNPYTDEVVVEDINPTGGKIYLTGRVSSTGGGKLVVLDGSTDIDITNNTGTNLTLGNINNNDVEGLISITDTRADGNTYVTEYKRDKVETIKLVNDKKTGEFKEVPVSGEGFYVKDKNGNYTYTPDEGLRYNWTEGYETTTKEEYKMSEYFKWWGAYTSKRDSLHEYEKDENKVPGGNGQTKTDKPLGSYIGKVDNINNDKEYIFIYDNDVNFNKTTVKEWTEYANWLHFKGWEHYEWKKETGSTQTYMSSVKADHAINIGFIGQENGTIDVASNSNITLNGSLKNNNSGGHVNIDSTIGSIVQKNGSIDSDNITLNAKTGIENINITSIGDTVNLSAVTEKGNIGIDVSAGLLDGKVTEGNINILNSITTGNGTVDLNARGDIIQSSEDVVSVKGNRINLISTMGEIDLIVQGGTENTTAGDSLSNSINAKAKENISLTQNEGDFRIGKVESETGDVTINVKNGSLIDALPTGDMVTDFSAEEKVERWKELGLIAGGEEFLAQRKQEAEDYKLSIINEYDSYKELEKYYAGKSGELDKEDKTYETYQKLNEKYSGYESAEQYLQADKTYAGLLEEPTYEWKENDLLYAIQDTMINHQGGSTQKEIKDPNIIGKNITIEAKQGGIGVDAGKETVDLKNLTKNDYEGMKKLAAAEAADVHWDGTNNTATITKKNPVGIQMKSEDGRLQVEANSNIYLAARVNKENGDSKTNAIYVDNITSETGNIRVLGTGGVYNVSETKTTNFTGKDLILEGGAGSLGTLNNPLTMALSGNLTARTDKDIYLNQTGDMNIVAMYAGGKDDSIGTSAGTIVLGATGNIFSVNQEGFGESLDGSGKEDTNLVLGYINAAGDIVLKAEGDIGTSEQGVNILNGADAKVDAEAENIYLAGKKEGALNLGTIIADTNIGITSESGIVTREELKTNLENGTIDLNAKNNILLGGTVSTNNLNIATIEGAVVENKDTNLTANNIIVNALNGIDLQGNNKINSITVTNNTNDILINNIGTKGLVVNVTKENAGNINITNAAGDIKVISDVTATGDNSNVTIENTGSIIFAENKNIAADNNVQLTSTKVGNIVVKNINAGNEILTTTNEGFVKGNKFTAENNITTSAKSGDITLANANAKQGNLTAGTSIGDITITTGTALGTAEITAETGNIKVNELTGSKISVTTENTAEELRGNIEIGNVTSTKEEILLATNIGNIQVTGKANAKTELSASTKSGAIDINNAVSGTNTNLTTTNGDIIVGTANVKQGNLTAGTSIGDISITTGTINGTTNISTAVDGAIDLGAIDSTGNLTAKTATGAISIDKGTIKGVTDISTAVDGNINLGTINSTDDITAGTTKGTITANDLTSGNNIKVTTNDGFIKGTNFIAANNITTSTNIGDITLDNAEAKQGNLSASTVNGNISIITGTALGTADITTKTGNIDITNLTADKDVTVKTETEGKITSTGKLTSINESLEVYSAKGDINLNEVYAKDQARVYAKDGDIYIKLINGDYVVITMGSKDHKMDVKEQIVGKGSMLSSNDITISDLSQREGYTTPVEVTFNNSEDNTNSPITRAELHAKGLPNGLLITQLWAKDAEISTDGKILQLPKLNITGIGHFANDTTTTTVYGENSGYDNTDISIWNQASLTVPTELQYILLNFTNEPNTIETDGILLKVTDGFKVYAEREAGEEIMLDKLKDFEAEINKSYILNSPFEFVYKPYLNYNLIDNNIENAGMPEIIVTKDKIIISGTKAKEDKEIPIIAVENTEEEEKEKIAQK